MAPAVRIDGKAIAANLRANISHAVQSLRNTHDLTPGLAVVLVGEHPASQVYVRNKEKQTKAIGMLSRVIRLPAECTQDNLLHHIHQLNSDSTIHGILVQLPLPDHIDSTTILNAVDPNKDVDGFHPINAGKLLTGQPSFVPCTPLGCLLLIKQVQKEITGAHAVVLGRSNIVGKPVAQLLLQENCTVTMAHSRTQNITEITTQADILVAAVGRPEMVKGDWIKPGAIVIDVGINRVPAPEKGEDQTKLVGDVAFDEAAQIAQAITPVPGGVGPMTIACLLRNTLQAACEAQNIDFEKVLLSE